MDKVKVVGCNDVFIVLQSADDSGDVCIKHAATGSVIHRHFGNLTACV